MKTTWSVMEHQSSCASKKRWILSKKSPYVLKIWPKIVFIIYFYKWFFYSKVIFWNSSAWSLYDISMDRGDKEKEWQIKDDMWADFKSAFEERFFVGYFPTPLISNMKAFGCRLAQTHLSELPISLTSRVRLDFCSRQSEPSRGSALSFSTGLNSALNWLLGAKWAEVMEVCGKRGREIERITSLAQWDGNKLQGIIYCRIIKCTARL